MRLGKRRRKRRRISSNVDAERVSLVCLDRTEREREGEERDREGGERDLLYRCDQQGAFYSRYLCKRILFCRVKLSIVGTVVLSESGVVL